MRLTNVPALLLRACMKKHYTYVHRKADTGEIFYVGKGIRRRAWTEDGRSDWWCKTAAKHGFVVEISAHWNTEDEALDHEVFLIKTFREMNLPIINQTDGGDGVSGLRHSEETRKILSQKTRDYFASEENRIAHRASIIAAWDEPTRGLASERAKEIWTEDFKRKHSETLKKSYSTPEMRAMQKAKSPIVNNRAAHEEKRRAALVSYWASAESMTDAAKAKRSETTKRAWITRKSK